ncbi:hypothetical protein [Longimicrobium sp.]|uniref:hypothetical protein n=1 Tax=Longimicrobium sp. TaxID=2029185 RepID=UPI003B3A8D4A
MRYMIATAALLVATIQATPAAAQVDVIPQQTAAVSAVTPLPAALVPGAPPAEDEEAAGFPMRRMFVSTGIGTLAGAGAGLLVGAITTDGCQPDESWCILGWEEEVAIHGVVGAMVGAGAGAIYGLVTAPGPSRQRSAPLTVAPAADGGMHVGLTLRH